MGIPKITNSQELKAACSKEGVNLVVMEFYGETCGPCIKIAPEVEQYAEEEKDVTFVKIEADESPELAKEFGVEFTPTFVLMKRGAGIVDTVDGGIAAVKEAVNKHK